MILQRTPEASVASAAVVHEALNPVVVAAVPSPAMAIINAAAETVMPLTRG